MDPSAQQRQQWPAVLPRHSVRWAFVVLAAVVVRLALFSIDGLSAQLGERIELNTPLSAFKRVQEALFLKAQGLSPYSGNVFHQPPLVLALFAPLQSLDPIWTSLLFIGCDVLVAAGLRIIAYSALSHTSTLLLCTPAAMQPSVSLLLRLPDITAAIYLFNPFTVLSCVSRSGVLLTHAAVVLTIAAAAHGRAMLSMLALAIAIYLDLYPILLFLPVVVLLQARQRTSQDSKAAAGLNEVVPLQWRSMLLCAVWCTVCVIVLLLASADFVRSTDSGLIGAVGSSSTAAASAGCVGWGWVGESYGWAVAVRDLQPNVGLFWYFVTEMFDRFRGFFLVLFQAHVLFYLLPLYWRFSGEPLFLCWVLVGVPLIFKPYPTVADTAFTFSLALVNARLVYPRMRRIFPVLWMFALSCCIGVVMWYLWIFPGSGNANFLYFQTLIFLFTQSFVLIEAIGSVRRLQAMRALKWQDKYFPSAVIVSTPAAGGATQAAAGARGERKKHQ